MPTTSPDSIYYADGTTPASIATITASIATSVQNALNVREARTYSWADNTAKAAQTGMATGETGYQIDTDTYYIYSGSAWRIWAKQLTSFTPTLTNFTNSSLSFVFSVASGVVSVSGHAICSGTVGEILISVPSGFNVNTALLPSSGAILVGTGGVDRTSSTVNHSLGVRVASATGFALVANAYNASGTGTLYSTIVPTSASIPATWDTGDVLSVNFSYPVA